MFQPKKNNKPDISKLNDEEELKAWLEMAEQHIVYDVEKSLKFAKRAKKLAGLLDNMEYYLMATNLIAESYFIKGKYTTSKPYLLEALKLSSETTNENELAKVYINLSNVEFEAGDLYKALEYIFKAKELAENNKDIQKITRCLLCIGRINLKLGNQVSATYYQKKVQQSFPENNDHDNEKIYADLGASYCYSEKYKEAAEHLEKAISLNKENGNIYSYCQNLSNLGWVLIKQSKFNQAEEKLILANEVTEKIGENRLTSYINVNLGTTVLELGRFNEAINYFKKAIGLKPKLEDRWIVLHANLGIAVCYKNLLEFNNAENAALKALKICVPIKAQTETKTIYKLLIDIALQQNDFKKAYEYQKLLFEFIDKLSQLETNEVQATIQEMFANIEKNTELDKHKILLKGERKLNEMLVTYNKEIEQKNTDIENQKLKLKSINQKLQKEIDERLTIEDRLKENERFLHSIITHMPVLVNVVNPEGIIVLSNGEKLVENNDWTIKNFIGKSIYELPISENLIKQYNRTKNGEKIVFESQWQNKHYQNFTIPINNSKGELQFVITVSTDISQIMQMKNQLELANVELKNFAYAASHDMKEPLRNIQSFGRLLSRKIYDDLDESSKEYMDFILESSKRMGILIDDLLTYASTGKNLNEAKPIDLNDIITIVEDNLKLKFKETNAILKVDKLPNVKAHFSMMTQLFQNLISNAIKFQPIGNQPVIKIQAIEIRNTFATFSIKDNGIGIEEKHLKEVFTVFRRLNARTEYEGSGIGMATCKKIIDAYNGKIWAKSALGKGTEFFITLPVS